MCSISGSVGLDNTFVIEANSHHSKRGPDNQSILRLCENIYFGHTLLSIIGNQTQPLENDKFALTYNGEWYNYKDFYPYETSDSIALLKSITSKGVENTLKDINGMFAFAVYDKVQRKIYCAVDRFGQKPLYYCHDGENFVFSSTPAAILTIKDKWQLNNEAVKSYFLLGSVFGDNSIWQGIKKLNGSELLEYDLDKNKLKISTYWRPSFIPKAKEIIEDLVIDAINKVKIADVPAFVFLSGGIDSTLVASQFQGFNAIHLQSPEQEYAELVARKYNLNLNIVKPENTKIEDDLRDYCYRSGEPTMSGLIPYVTSREVSKYGRLAIIANGADELFFGYDRTHDTIQDSQLKHIFRSISHRMNIPMETQFNGNNFHGRLLELNSYVQFDLNKTLDTASMCHSLEVRSPFLDHRLVETALSIPESEHKKEGNKTILKNILKRQGFTNDFLNRPKLGFSLHYQPENMEYLKTKALTFCLQNRFLETDKHFTQLSGRDQLYLKMSCLGFYYWYKTWEHKL